MRRNLMVVMAFACVFLAGCQCMEGLSTKADGWQSLFDGKTLDGWKASENKGTWMVRDGMLVTHGEQSHLFYVGPVNHANFKNFELQAEVKTEPGSNSGIYFHTEYQESGWPEKGYECQVNNTHTDHKKTGGLYVVQDVMDNSPAKDGEWFRYYIKVEGRHIVIRINDRTTVDWTEPEDWQPPDGMSGRRLSSGTFAIQGHDPKSIVYYKDIQVRMLP